eukprot:12977725-Alexandrium_andersonii.AAC.1
MLERGIHRQRRLRNLFGPRATPLLRQAARQGPGRLGRRPRPRRPRLSARHSKGAPRPTARRPATWATPAGMAGAGGRPRRTHPRPRGRP